MTPSCVDICPPIISIEKKQSQLKSFAFSSLLFYMEEKQTLFVDVQSCLQQKAGCKCRSGKSKMSTKHAISRDIKINGRVIK